MLELDLDALRDAGSKAHWAERVTKLNAMADGAFANALRDRAVKQYRMEVALANAKSARDHGRANADRCAREFAAIAARHGLRCSAWCKVGDARVYFANGDHVAIGHDGTISEVTRGRVTFLASNLYRAERAAYRATVADYLAWRRA